MADISSRAREGVMERRLYTIEDIVPSTRRLMEMEKRPIEAMDAIRWPLAGKGTRVELESCEDRSIRFWLDLAESSRSSVLIIGIVSDRKTKQQVRAGGDQLVRIDMADRPEVIRHRNPDGTVLMGSHIHLDIEGYGIRWALPLDEQTVVVPDGGVRSVANMFAGLIESCHVVGLPRVEFSLGV